MKPSLSIGVFDSGVGGLTVLKELQTLLPHENFIYLGDTARVPYGNRSPEVICRYSLEGTQFLKRCGIKLLVVACHSASSWALRDIEKQLNIPVIGVIKEAVSQLLKTKRVQRVAILSTRATLNSGVYPKEIQKKNNSIEVVSIACPLFVPLIEEGFEEHPLMDLAIQEYLHPLQQNAVDTVLLACTHYPLIKKRLLAYLGETTTLLDPGYACAQNVKDTLRDLNWLNTASQKGITQFFVSDGPQRTQAIASRFLGRDIPLVQLMEALEGELQLGL